MKFKESSFEIREGDINYFVASALRTSLETLGAKVLVSRKKSLLLVSNLIIGSNLKQRLSKGLLL